MLFYEQHIVSSPLDSREVIYRLNRVIGQDGIINEYLFGSTPYYGKIVGQLFVATRISAYNIFSRSFPGIAPAINGKVVFEPKGCTIEFSICPGNIGKKGAYIFFSIVSLIFLILLIIFIWACLESQVAEKIFSIFILGILSVIYVVQWILFKIEAITIRNYFCDLFESEIL